MNIEDSLSRLANLNKNIIDQNEILNGNSQYNRMLTNQSSLHDMTAKDSIKNVKELAKELITKEDEKRISSIDDLFNILDHSINQRQYISERAGENFKKNILDKKLLIEEIKNQSTENKNLNILMLNNFEFNKGSKMIEYYKELGKEYPEKFEFELIQNMSLRQDKVNVISLFHGDLNELLDTIKKTKNKMIRNLSGTSEKNLTQFFKSHFEENIIFEKNKIIKLNEFNNEEFKLIYENNLNIKFKNNK
jgi:hypothetical protein